MKWKVAGLVLVAMSAMGIVAWGLFDSVNEWLARPVGPAVFILRPNAVVWAFGTSTLALPAGCWLVLRRFPDVKDRQGSDPRRVLKWLLWWVTLPTLMGTIAALPMRTTFYDTSLSQRGYGQLNEQDVPYSQIKSIIIDEFDTKLCLTLKVSSDSDWSSCGLLDPDRSTTLGLIQFLESKTGLKAETRQ